MPSITNALRRLSFLIAGALVCVGVRAAEVIPPAPANHFNDYAGIVPAATAARLNQELAQFERDSSNQIVVAIYPKMQSDSSVEDYAVRVAQKWGVGQKDKKNGAGALRFPAESRPLDRHRVRARRCAAGRPLQADHRE